MPYGYILASRLFGWQDWGTLGLFFLGLIGIVWWVIRQKEETTADYFLAGRNAGWVTAAGGFSGLVVGFVVGMSRLVLVIFQKNLNPEGVLYKVVAINWLHFCILLFLLTCTLIILVSLFTKKPTREQTEGLTFGSSTPEQTEETRESWNKWDVIHSLIVIGAIVAFYVYFW